MICSLLFRPGGRLTHSPNLVFVPLCLLPDRPPRVPQRLSFARGTSDALAKQKGTWLPKDKRSVQKRMLEDRSAQRCACAPHPGLSVTACPTPFARGRRPAAARKSRRGVGSPLAVVLPTEPFPPSNTSTSASQVEKRAGRLPTGVGQRRPRAFLPGLGTRLRASRIRRFSSRGSPRTRRRPACRCFSSSSRGALRRSAQALHLLPRASRACPVLGVRRHRGAVREPPEG